jgi:hypothetical protein
MIERRIPGRAGDDSPGRHRTPPLRCGASAAIRPRRQPVPGRVQRGRRRRHQVRSAAARTEGRRRRRERPVPNPRGWCERRGARPRPRSMPRRNRPCGSADGGNGRRKSGECPGV